jgi:hypothetical protein
MNKSEINRALKELSDRVAYLESRVGYGVPQKKRAPKGPKVKRE